MPKILTVTLVILSILILIFLAASLAANYMFNQKVKDEVRELFGDAKNKDGIIVKNNLEGLPPCVQKWLINSQVIGKKKIKTVRLKQKALMRTKPGSPWMPTEAEQYFTTEKPGFIWKAKIKAAPLFSIVGRDKYFEGKGNMLIKILSLITVADAKGKEIDQGTLLRYLAETVWFPTAALSSYITWEEIDASSAKAEMSYKGVTASGVFKFNQEGEVINFTADRYMEQNGKYSLEKWSVNMGDYKEFSGIRIPTKGEATWKLKTGDFNWYRFQITEVEYDKPEVF